MGGPCQCSCFGFSSMLLAQGGQNMAAPPLTFAPQRSTVVGPLSWGLGSCAPGMCPWCLLNCGHQDLQEAESRARIMLEELERVAAPHWAGHLVVLLVNWCRSEMLNFHEEIPGRDVPKVSLVALGFYAGLRVPRPFDVFSSGVSASSGVPPPPPLGMPPPPGMTHPHASDDPSQPRKIYRPSGSSGEGNAGASASALPYPLSLVPPPANVASWLGANYIPGDPIFEYWGGKKTGWVPYDLNTQLLLRGASDASGGCWVSTVCNGTRYHIDVRPDVMEQTNPNSDQAPRKVRIRPPEEAD